MKNYEELARIHVNEAIQHGLEAQRIHRALSKSREKQSPVNFSVLPSLVNFIMRFSQLTTLFNKFKVAPKWLQ